ncbi:hypothetical protein T484DRAFT_2021992, partial [Baffinella frigidus]
MAQSGRYAWTSPSRGGLTSTAPSTPQHPRPYSMPAVVSPSRAPQQDTMGGVGIVFYRDAGSPYLLVKDVVVDGPAYKSSLIYPGDRLCCINDFDLAWSGTTPRQEQPQLPGPHGSAVQLTFDRSVDSSYPERFSITLVRSMAFFPDRLSSTLRADAPRPLAASLPAPTPQAPLPMSGWPAKEPHTQPHVIDVHPVSSAHVASRAAFDGGRNNPTLAQTPHVVWRTDLPKLASTPSNDRHLWNGAVPGPPESSPPSGEGRMSRGTLGESRGSRYSEDDLDELIQEIARKDEVLELQQRLALAERAHESELRQMLLSRASLESLSSTLREDASKSHARIAELERMLRDATGYDEWSVREQEARMEELRQQKLQLDGERARLASAEQQLRAEWARMDQSVAQQGSQLRETTAELEKERALRIQTEHTISTKHAVDLDTLRRVQTEKELMFAQNEVLRREIMEMQIHFATE